MDIWIFWYFYFLLPRPPTTTNELSLGAVIAIFSGIMYFQDKISGPGTLPTSTSYISRYHFIMTFFGILLTFTPMHFLGFNVMPRRIPDFPDYFNSWNYLSSIGSGITLICWLYLQLARLDHERVNQQMDPIDDVAGLETAVIL